MAVRALDTFMCLIKTAECIIRCFLLRPSFIS